MAMVWFPAVVVVNSNRVHVFALIFILLVVLLFAIFIAFAFVLLFRSHTHPGRVLHAGHHPYPAIDPPELVLARRLASGEIGEDEYHSRLDALHGRATAPPRPGKFETPFGESAPSRGPGPAEPASGLTRPGGAADS
jgi:uncharacterized membrane protein